MKASRDHKNHGSEEEQRLFNELCEALNRMGIETRVEKGNFRGGFCVIEGEKKILFINKKHDFDKRIALLISELKKLYPQGLPLSEDILSKISAC